MCERCQGLGKEVCWDVHADATGDWTKSFCCGAFEQTCKEHYYCSSKVSNSLLKEMTCPIDQSKCPTQQESTIDLRAASYG